MVGGARSGAAGDGETARTGSLAGRFTAAAVGAVCSVVAETDPKVAPPPAPAVIQAGRVA
jgi:hypothetical protein